MKYVTTYLISLEFNLVAMYSAIPLFNYTRQPHMFTIKDGIVQNAIIKPNLFNNLEHGPLKTVAGIVLHQTNKDTAETTLLLYRNRPNGAHFLISPEGVIYQTARVDRVCFHVGHLASRCKAEHTCSPNYLAALARLEPLAAVDENARMTIHKLETAKPITARYPSNTESIGIEVSGAPIKKVYQPPTVAQNVASTWLVAQLLATFKLDRTNVFKHGTIGYDKEPSEAMHVKY
jgi:hypothetical protein